MSRKLSCALLLIVVLAPSVVGRVLRFRPAVSGGSIEQDPPYSDGKAWLCRPGRHDACDVDLATTIVKGDGTLTREAWKADANAPVDCFYVYPTVSTDPTPNSDMTADPAELNVVRHQFARFASKCRPYAPIYRQVTLAGLRTRLAGGAGGPLGGGLAYDDVRDAWNYYLAHDNNGRGVVLVGHSQGSFILAELLRQEIDGKPIQSRIVSAILPGATIAVPRGKDVGGMFKQMPLCRAATQTGCVIAYSSFRSTSLPPANTRFGKVADQAMAAACTNPAALAGGSGELHAYLPNDGNLIVNRAAPKPWVTPERPVETPWVSLPGLLTAQCSSNENATYLEVTVHGNPADPRVDDIFGDLITNNQVLTDWGLHLIDVNLALGNLVDLVGRQSAAWRKSAGTR
jgi:hypothetical protein